MRLTRDFVEFIECCARRDVSYLIVGYAVAAHGHPRATKDLDIWVLIEPANAERLIGALNDFGMGSVGLTAADFLEPEVVVQLGYPPIRIDLLTSIAGIAFSECWPRRVMIDVGGIEAGFISAEDLITNKRAAGRPQDLVDADILEQVAEEIIQEAFVSLYEDRSLVENPPAWLPYQGHITPHQPLA